MQHLARRIWFASYSVFGSLAAIATQAATLESANQEPPGAIVVIGVTPLQGLEVPRDLVPTNVQRFDIDQFSAPNMARILEDSSASFSLRQTQGNSTQSDVAFRGLTASPLLGTSNGLSVFMDGVRINESFGDAVLWDLIPMAAVRSLTIIPGSNPVFGFNTLGGALSLQTKTGRTDPGVGLNLNYASLGERSGSLNVGSAGSNFDAFGSAHYTDDSGWRDHSPARLRDIFASFGWQDDHREVRLTYLHASNDLSGNGPVPESLLHGRREAVYTYPDHTDDDVGFAALTATRSLSHGWSIKAQAYDRRVSLRTLNGDIEEARQEDDLASAFVGETRHTRTEESTSGWALQVASAAKGEATHYFAAGFTYDRGRTMFRQLDEDSVITNDGEVLGEGQPDLVTDVDGQNRYESIYATDTIALTPNTSMTIAARYDQANIRIRDRSGAQPQLDGNHRFSRLNPAAGFTFAIKPDLALFANYSEGFRAPTAVELTCADPNAPCSLPVGFISDPPLAPVIARSTEVGARGHARRTHWSAAAFQTRLSNDILFTADATGRGYFTNTSGTRRRGVEARFEIEFPQWQWRASYAYVAASYESALALFDPNATDEAPSIFVQPGDRIPGMPRHRLDTNIVWHPSAMFDIGGELKAYSKQFLRGDEGNDRPQLSGYVLVNLYASAQLNSAWCVSARIENLFDKHYASMGAYGRSAFDQHGGLRNEPQSSLEAFLAPGAPRSFWIGVEYSLAR